jgi:hypothetical protein
MKDALHVQLGTAVATTVIVGGVGVAVVSRTSAETSTVCG